LSLTWFLFLICIFLGLGAWLVFVWGVRSGMFRNAEDTSRRMLDLDLREFASGDGPKATPERENR
jgi:cbb3-type cytochrome oxidase maturation protein